MMEAPQNWRTPSEPALEYVVADCPKCEIPVLIIFIEGYTVCSRCSENIILMKERK